MRTIKLPLGASTSRNTRAIRANEGHMQGRIKCIERRIRKRKKAKGKKLNQESTYQNNHLHRGCGRGQRCRPARCICSVSGNGSSAGRVAAPCSINTSPHHRLTDSRDGKRAMTMLGSPAPDPIANVDERTAVDDKLRRGPWRIENVFLRCCVMCVILLCNRWISGSPVEF